MFKPTRTHRQFRPQDAQESSQRWVYFAAGDAASEKPGEGKSAPTKGPEISSEKKEAVKKILETADAFSDWNKDKDRGENSKELASKIAELKDDPTGQKAAADMIKEQLDKITGIEAKLSKSCKYMQIKNGNLNFYKDADFDKEENKIVFTRNGARLELKPGQPAETVAPGKKEGGPNETVAVPPETADKDTMKIFKEWFPNAKSINQNGSINAQTYRFNIDPGKPTPVYLQPTAETKGGRTTSDRAFDNTYKPAVHVKDGQVMEVDGVKYVLTDSAKVTVDGNTSDKQQDVWVRVSDLVAWDKEKKAWSDRGPEAKSAWGNPEKGMNDGAIKEGTIDQVGEHVTKNATEFFSYEGGKKPAIAKGEKVQVLDKNIYNIDGEKYVRVQYLYKENEGWVKASDLYSTTAVAVEETEADKKEKSNDAGVAFRRAQFETNPDKSLHFKTPEEQEKTKLKDILLYAQEGDTIEITAKGQTKAKIATYHNGDFYYDGGKGSRAIILEGYKLGEYKKAQRLTGSETVPEGINSIGSIRLNAAETSKDLKTYLDVAKAVLDKGNDLAKLKSMGFQLQSQKMLDDLRKSNTNPYEYADLLKQKQVGDRIFIVMVTKTVETAVGEMGEKAVRRRNIEMGKLKKKDGDIVSREIDHLDEKDRYTIDKDIVSLAKDEKEWNKVWDSEDGGVIKHKDRLLQVWAMMPPYNRSGDELRDLVRKFIVESGSTGFLGLGERTGTSMKLFLETFDVYTKEDKSKGSYEDFIKEYNDVKGKYEKLDSKTIDFYSSGKAQQLFERVYDQMTINRQKYGPNATTAQTFEGLKEDEVKFATGVFMSDSFKTFERYNYLNAVMNGSILMMDGITRLEKETNLTESHEARELTDGEKRVDEIFDRNDKGGATASDLATESKEGKTTEFRVLPWLQNVPLLSLLAINWAGGEPKFFNQYSSGESAWLGTLDRCRDDKGQVDEKKLVVELNKLLFVGIQGMMKAEAATGDAHIDPKEMYQSLNIDPADPNRDKILYERLKLNGTDAHSALISPIDSTTPGGKYQKLLIRIGYLVDQSASEGKTETPESKSETKEINPDVIEKLSSDPAIRTIQVEAVKRGYPANEIDKIEPQIKSQMVAGAIVDLGGDGRGIGAGAATAIPIGHDIYVGIGVGYFNHGWQTTLGIGTQKDLAENITGGAGVGASMPISGPNKWKPQPGIGAGIEVTLPIENSSWDGWIALGVSSNLRQIVEEGGVPNVSVGVMGGLKWNPSKAIDLETKSKLEEYKLDQIDEALKAGDRKQAVDLIMQHPSLGKLAAFMTMQYGWSEDDVIKMYEEQKQSIRNAAVDNINPVITRFGVGAGVSLGAGVPQLELGVVIAFNVGKTTTLYRTTSRSATDMMASGDKAIEEQLMKKVNAQFPDSKVEFSKIETFHETSKIVYGLDGQPAIDAKEQEFNFKDTMGAKDLEAYNAQLKDAGIQLKQGAGEEKGLLEIVIPELNGTDDPAYDKRTTRVYIDPSLEGKGLVLRNGHIFLASSANPDLVVRRFKYRTQFADQDGACDHNIIAITDVPGRSVEEIAKASGKYIYKHPGQPLQIRESGTGIDQTNVMGFQEYKKNADSYEQYSEKDWSPYQKAVMDRQATFESVSGQPVRAGLVPNEDKDITTDCFSKRFYDKYHTEYKKLTTGETTDIGSLFQKLDKEWENDKSNSPKSPLSAAEKNRIFLNLTRRSWASINNLDKKEKEKALNERLDWAKSVLLPIWKKKIDTINEGKDPKVITESAETLLDLVIKNLRDTDLSKDPEKLPEGSLTNTLAGTEKIEGFRPNNGADSLLGLDRYAQFLGQNSKEGQIARVILDTISPIPTENADFMVCPLALKVLSKRALALAWGVDRFNEITECYAAFKKDGVAGLNQLLLIDRYKASFEAFKKLVSDIREAETNVAGSNMVELDNGCYIKVKPIGIAAGVDKTCANFSMSANEDFDVLVLTPGQAIVYGASAAEHNTVSANKVPSWFQLGIGAIGTLKPETSPPPPPPPGNKTPETPNKKPAEGSSNKEDAGTGKASDTSGGNTGGTKGSQGAPKDTGDNPPPPVVRVPNNGPLRLRPGMIRRKI